MDPYTDFKLTSTTPVSGEEDEAGPSTKPRRGTRACDRCRKIKSKCESTEGDRCKNCIATGSPCTFQDPSFKRGPPKGYIHAIEQRWQQVECILATVMASPRATSIFTDLRQDAFARSVLDRVDSGPYGQRGRAQQTRAVTQEGFYDTIMGSELGSTYEDRRSRRQSRVSREIVSVQDTTPTAVPTLEWQNHLSRRLTHPSGFSSPSPVASVSSVADTSRNTPSSPSEPSRRRFRVEGVSSSDATARGPHEMYTLGDAYYNDYENTVDALGYLSVNENQDVRYHGKSAGLHLLARSARNDDSETKENGIWKFRVPKEEATDSIESLYGESYEPVSLPSPAVQDHLINLYFAYVHPFLPVIHKNHFLLLYNQRRYSPQSRHGKSIQGISDLLLLSMFAFAARYSDDETYKHPSTSEIQEQVSKGGQWYAANARKVLNAVYEHSRPSTCQALLLMGVREYGIGSMEQGWLYVGMGCRMAVDLGMNHNADEWKDSRGEFLFSVADRQARKQIWTSCCVADKISSIWLGRPVMFREHDFNAGYPEVLEEEEEEEWLPYPPDALGPDFRPESCRIMSYFREQSKLTLILSQIMTKIYPVKFVSDTPKRAELEQLESRLHSWLIELPDHLRYYETSRRLVPLPHVLALHIEYQYAVLLLHRAFIPNWNDPVSSSNPGLESDALPLKSFDICQGAAAHISSMIAAFHDRYGLNRCPPLFNTFLQGAGIMHVVTLMRRPGNTQGTVGLLRCIDAARAMEATWPCAVGVRHLLQGANVQLDDMTAWAATNTTTRPGKRLADEALGPERSSDVLPRDIFSGGSSGMDNRYPSQLHPNAQLPHHRPHESDERTRLMAQQPLGVPLSMPIQPPTSYYPGYEWWPQSMMNLQQYGATDPVLQFHSSGGEQMVSDFPTQSTFTFDEDQLSSNFTDNVSRNDGPVPSHFRSGR